MVLSVDVSLSKVDNLGPKAITGVREYLETGADRGFAQMVEEIPVDRGTLQSNAFSPVWERGRLVYGVRGSDYARAQDEGTGPIPNLPITPLLEWGERVLGSRDAGAAVWQHIREEGIEPKGFSRAARHAQRNWYASHGIQKWLDRHVE